MKRFDCYCVLTLMFASFVQRSQFASQDGKCLSSIAQMMGVGLGSGVANWIPHASPYICPFPLMQIG